MRKNMLVTLKRHIVMINIAVAFFSGFLTVNHEDVLASTQCIKAVFSSTADITPVADENTETDFDYESESAQLEEESRLAEEALREYESALAAESESASIYAEDKEQESREAYKAQQESLLAQMHSDEEKSLQTITACLFISLFVLSIGMIVYLAVYRNKRSKKSRPVK